MATPADAGRDARGRATQGAVAETAVPLERIAVNRKAAGTVAVVGNPNAGKSSVFNRLTGLRQHTANYPGVTVERRVGRGMFGGVSLDLIDLPGTYSLSPTSTDERSPSTCCSGASPARRGPTRFSAVIDSTRLYQGLYLLQQLVELGRPMIVALTMIDAAEREGRKIDFAALQEALGGVPVYPVVATSGRGFAALNEALAKILDGCRRRATRLIGRSSRARPRRSSRVGAARGADLHRVEAERLLIDASAHALGAASRRRRRCRARRAVRRRAAARGRGAPPLRVGARHAGARRVAGLGRRDAGARGSSTGSIGRGRRTALLLVLMFVVFQAVFAWATPLVDLIDAGVSGLGAARRGRVAGRHDRELRRRRRDRRRRQRDRVPAADPDPVPVHHPHGGHGLSRARGVPRRSRDAQRRPVGPVGDPAVVELRVRGAVDHGDARDSESARPHRDDPGRAVHDVLGALARLRAADRRVRARAAASASSICRASCCSACT